MMSRRTLLASFTALGAALGAAPAPAAAQPGVDRPQPRLPTEPMVILGRDGRRHDFTVEMAITPDHQTIGLMFRTEIAANEGMIFDWGRPRESSMWMRNTLIPLDMLFADPTGRITRIHDNAVPLDETSIDGGEGVQFVLEINGGMAARLGITVGDVMQHPSFGPTAAAPCE
jgi:uncharacterized membrane protein (UPF0127 family)